ncbi:hypothetical protein LR48_Vigan06g120300 [Vigna angularis]|uniref:Uncharacterized protein n=1 Tax=Phaseolus angularis TaxID=3914 RepID=A0A0L9UTI5_PHAAN|nr:hypothetical protein LR48_Vigan06g120300 [Vigna angularis]
MCTTKGKEVFYLKRINRQLNPSNTTSSPFSLNLLTAPKPQASSDLPEDTNRCYSEILNAVKKDKVERVRFSKDDSILQLTIVDGRRAFVIVPNDPNLIDILAMNDHSLGHSSYSAEFQEVPETGVEEVLGNVFKEHKEKRKEAKEDGVEVEDEDFVDVLLKIQDERTN